jgi:F0F1-type ATP synthase alpha subunit
MRSFADIKGPEDAKAFLLEHVQVCAAHRSVLAFTVYMDTFSGTAAAPTFEKVANRCLICADINYQAGRAYGRLYMLKTRRPTVPRLTFLWDAEWEMPGAP